ncbi:hypothetical protein NW133_07160 [Staphylococcus pettenkoferi]|uniref:Uncharacterized protein n=1 Tax=Staphylococcus pettenkoferi TaxID=170573 RepID=A0ABT4BKV7_9STAP|nr:hypothetical protein [Staphylococcus pettenkoferi]MCY1563865.1 hypothetical protein [Staphylococcus pettenkoferi]MCY1583305.1 hypothetical protein [Staphylococcus pettenkoferi]
MSLDNMYDLAESFEFKPYDDNEEFDEDYYDEDIYDVERFNE